MGVPLPQPYQSHPSLVPAPAPCLLSRNIPVLQLPIFTQEAAFPFLEAAFLYATAFPMLISSPGSGTWR